MDLISHLNKASLVAIKENILELISGNIGKATETTGSAAKAVALKPKRPSDLDCEIPLEVFLKAALQELLKVSDYISRKEIQIDPLTNKYYLKSTNVTLGDDTCKGTGDLSESNQRDVTTAVESIALEGSLYARLTKLLKKLCVLWELSDIDGYGRLRWDSFSNFCLRLGRTHFKESVKQTNLNFALISKGHSTIPNHSYYYVPSINILVSHDTDACKIRIYKKFGKKVMLVETWDMLDTFLCAINPRTIQQEALAATKSKQAAYMITKAGKKFEDYRPPDRVRILAMCVIDGYSSVYLSMSSSHLVKLSYKPPLFQKEEQESDGDSDFSDGDDEDKPAMNHGKTFELTETIATKQIQTGLFFSKSLNMLISWSGYSGSNAFRLWEGVSPHSMAIGSTMITLENGSTEIKTSNLIESFEVHLHNNVIVAICEVTHGHWRYIASCSADRDVLLWAINFDKKETSGQRFISGVSKFKLHGHQKGIKSLVYAPQNMLLVGAGYDTVIYIWDPFSKHLVYELKGHTGTIDALTVSYFPTEHLLSIDEHRCIKVWRLRKGFEGRCEEVCTLPLDVEMENGIGAAANDGAIKKKVTGANPTAGNLNLDEREESNTRHAIQLDRYHIHGMITAFERGRYFVIRSDLLYVFMFKGSLSKDIRPVKNGLAIAPDSKRIISLSPRLIYLFGLDTGLVFKQVHFLDNEITDKLASTQKEAAEIPQIEKKIHSGNEGNLHFNSAGSTKNSKQTLKLTPNTKNDLQPNQTMNSTVGATLGSKPRPKSARAIRSSSSGTSSISKASIQPEQKPKTVVPPSTFNEKDSIRAVTFDLRFKKMFLGTNSGVVHVYDTSSLSLVRTLEMPKNTYAPIPGGNGRMEMQEADRGFVTALSYVQRDGLLVAVFSSGVVAVFNGCISPSFPEQPGERNVEGLAKYLHLRPEPPKDTLGALIRSSDHPLVLDNSVSVAAVSSYAGYVAVGIGETTSTIHASRIYLFDYCSMLLQIVTTLPFVSSFTLKRNELMAANPGLKVEDIVPDLSDLTEPTPVFITDMAFAADLPLFAVGDSVGRITLFRTCIDTENAATTSEIYRIITWMPWESNILNKPTIPTQWNVIHPSSGILSLKFEFIEEPTEELISSIDTSVSNIKVNNLSLEKEGTGQNATLESATRYQSKPADSNSYSNIKFTNNVKTKSKADNAGLVSQPDFDDRCAHSINGKWCIIFSNSSKNVVIQDITQLILKEKTLIEYKTENVAVDASGTSGHRLNYKFTTYSNKYIKSLDYDGRLRNYAAYRYETYMRYHYLDGLAKFPEKIRRLEECIRTPVGSMELSLESGPNKQVKADITTKSYLALERLQHGNVVTVTFIRESNVIGISFEDGVLQFRDMSSPGLELAGQCEDSSAALRMAPLADDGKCSWNVTFTSAKHQTDLGLIIRSTIRHISNPPWSLSGASASINATSSFCSDGDSELQSQIDGIGALNQVGNFSLSQGSSLSRPTSYIFGQLQGKRAIDGQVESIITNNVIEPERDLEKINFEKPFRVKTDYLVWKDILDDNVEESEEKLEDLNLKNLRKMQHDVQRSFKKVGGRNPLSAGQADKEKVDKIQSKFNQIFQVIQNRVEEKEKEKRKGNPDSSIDGQWSHQNTRATNERKINMLLDPSPVPSPSNAVSPLGRRPATAESLTSNKRRTSVTGTSVEDPTLSTHPSASPDGDTKFSDSSFNSNSNAPKFVEKMRKSFTSSTPLNTIGETRPRPKTASGQRVSSNTDSKIATDRITPTIANTKQRNAAKNSLESEPPPSPLHPTDSVHLATLGQSSTNTNYNTIASRPKSAPMTRSDSSSTNLPLEVPGASVPHPVNNSISTLKLHVSTSFSSAQPSPTLNSVESLPHYMTPTKKNSDVPDPQRLKYFADKFEGQIESEKAATKPPERPKGVVSHYANLNKKKNIEEGEVLVKNKSETKIKDSSYISVESLGPYKHKEIISIAGLLLELLADELRRRDISNGRKERTSLEYKEQACTSLLTEDNRINFHIVMRNKTVIASTAFEKETRKALGAESGLGGAPRSNSADNPGLVSKKEEKESEKLAAEANIGDILMADKIMMTCKKSFDACISIQELLDIFFNHTNFAQMNRIVSILRLALMLEDLFSSAIVKDWTDGGGIIPKNKTGTGVSIKSVQNKLKALAVGAPQNALFKLTHLPSISHGFEDWVLKREKVERLTGFLDLWCHLKDGGLNLSDLILTIQGMVPADHLTHCRPVLAASALIRDRLNLKMKSDLNSAALEKIFKKVFKIEIV